MHFNTAEGAIKRVRKKLKNLKPGYQSSEERRVRITSTLACKLVGASSAKECYEKLGCGRRNEALIDNEEVFVIVCEKEVWPPRFWFGGC